jgi:hypothetical protein
LKWVVPILFGWAVHFERTSLVRNSGSILPFL